MTTSLRLNQVGKTFASGTAALSPLDLEIKTGEFVALVGPSGCGKSSLLRLMAALSMPSQGVIERPDNLAKDIGFVFQEPTLMPWASVEQNVALPLRLRGMSKPDIARAVKDVLTWVGLDGFAHSYPRQLSGGMRMRTSIARALAATPCILLLDEPFAALDEFTRAKLNDDLLNLWEQHRWSVVFVTHSIREAAYLADRIIVMSPRPGRIVADLSVPFIHPRQPALRDTHEFSDFCVEVSSHLANAMPAAA